MGSVGASDSKGGESSSSSHAMKIGVIVRGTGRCFDSLWFIILLYSEGGATGREQFVRRFMGHGYDSLRFFLCKGMVLYLLFEILIFMQRYDDLMATQSRRGRCPRSGSRYTMLGLSKIYCPKATRTSTVRD